MVDQFINPKHVAYATDSEYQLCSTDIFFYSKTNEMHILFSGLVTF